MADILVRTDHITQPQFAGVGFHVSFHQHHPTPEHEQLLWTRWRELNPSFARLGWLLKDGQTGLDALADLLLRMKETGTEVYLVTWDPEDLQPGPGMNAYARRIVDQLEHLVRERGAINLRYYCMTNELSMRKWASMVGELPRFRAYHQAIWDQLRARGLKLELLATDASPNECLCDRGGREAVGLDQYRFSGRYQLLDDGLRAAAVRREVDLDAWPDLLRSGVSIGQRQEQGHQEREESHLPDHGQLPLQAFFWHSGLVSS